MNARDGSRRTSGPHEDWDGRSGRRIVADWYGIQRSRGEQFLMSFELFLQLMSRSPRWASRLHPPQTVLLVLYAFGCTMGPRIGVFPCTSIRAGPAPQATPGLCVDGLCRVVGLGGEVGCVAEVFERDRVRAGGFAQRW